jgi:hypothetical protein
MHQPYLIMSLAATESRHPKHEELSWNSFYVVSERYSAHAHADMKGQPLILQSFIINRA